MDLRDEFEAFYKEYLAFSVSLANSIVKDEALAQDISQEVFCHLYKIFANIDLTDSRKLKALVTVATVNKSKDHFKKSYVKAETPFSSVNGTIPALHINSMDVALVKTEIHQTYSKVLMELKEKNPENYDILMKVKYYDMSPAAVAEEYGMSYNTLANRIYRTKEWLQKRLHHSIQ